MDVEAIYRNFTNGAKDGAIRAGWVERYLESPITLWCNLHAPVEAKDSMNDQMQHIFDIGNIHQDRVNERMYPGGIQKVFRSEEEGFRQSLEIMCEAAQFIKDMPLVCWSHGLTGRPDILERVDGIPSVFGDFSYRVVEIKSAKKLRESQMLQAALYNRVLGLVQGYEQPVFRMVNGDFEVIPVTMADVEPRLDQVLDEVREIMAGKPIDFCYGAAGWPWASYVDSQAIAANDVSLIVGVGTSVRQNLVEAGYATLQSIAAANETELLNVERVGPASARKMVVSAQAIQSQKPLPRGELLEILRGKTEVFFDFEGAQEQDQFETSSQVNYLIGAVHRSNGNEAKYKAFFADKFDLEGDNLAEFLDWAALLDDPVFYHWHHYERTHLAKMAERWEVDPGKAWFVLGRLEDLSPWATKGYAFPAYGEGLKAIAKSLGFEWQQDDVSGVGSMALYESFVNSNGTDQTSKDKIIIYNEDDCFATMHIYDWVMAQQA
ncbi:MAG: TM0106 family RecB-like putative nuclease [Dehalococcoidia bacterium]|nr:TM0106 family RecB-like putative nuclease [Dehalococcoidia bacterium]